MIDWPKTPERIWAWYCMPEKQNDVMVGGWDEVPDPKETEYTRSDLAAALLARAEAAEARVAALEGAFDDLRALANECSRDRKSRAIEKRITEFFAVLP